MFGIDIASYQKSMDFRRENFDFAIIKATEGFDYTSPSFKYYAVELTKLGKLIGCYHFARPDRHCSVAHINREADWFVKNVEEAGLVGKAILALDWEKEPIMRPDLISAFMNRVIALTGVRPFLYASEHILKTSVMFEIVKLYPVWMAKWPYRQTINPAQVNDFVKKHLPGMEPVHWDIWQFSDNGCWDGYQGTIDFNWTHMSEKEWVYYASTAKTWAELTSEKGPEKKPENLSDDMAWAISNGLFKGYGDGRYGPTDYLTRDQMARVLRRYTAYIVGQIQKAIENS